MSDMVRIDGKITVDVMILVSQEEYEKWDAGDAAAATKVSEQLADAAREMLEETRPCDVELDEAWLVEDDGYMGTEIVRLKKF